MALFKILKGDSSRISTDVTPFHDGYAYFTPDNGGFYIDSEDNGVQIRHKINPGSASITATLSSTGWSSGKQTLQVEGITPESNGVIGLSKDVSSSVIESVKKSELYVSGQGDGTITISSRNGTPTVNIPIVIILFD